MDRGAVGTPTPRGLEDSYDRAVVSSLPVVALGLCGVSVAFAVRDGFALEAADRVTSVATAAAVAVLLGVLALVAHRRRLPPSWGHPLAAAALVAVAIHPALVMVLAEQPRQSTYLLLAIAASGVLLLSLRWLIATLYLLWGAWTAGALILGPSTEWVHHVVGLVLATALAAVMSNVRRSAVRELAAAASAAQAAAVRDQLSGLANRRGLAMVGAQIVEQARRQGDAAHCIFVDIDGLQQVNRTLGHSAGDEVIVAVADAMRVVTRATDVVARWGGDQFCVVGPGPGMAPLELERRVRETVLLHAPVPAEVWPARVNAGGAMLAPWDSGSLDTLLGKADQEMHLRRSLRRETASVTRRPAAAD